jgi:AAA+ ATPase superfamily predicted ATPase
MIEAPFVGRKRELSLIQSEWESDRASLLILYGRRRIGKTRLLTHWIKTEGPRALFWVATPTSSATQLRSFSKALFGFESDAPVPNDFSYASWEQAFEQVARMAEHERLVLVLDEYTYLTSQEKGLSGILQNAWDHKLKYTNLFLIISGSHLGMMVKEILSYQAPLYGRATARLKVQPLPYSTTKGVFHNYKTDERVALYSIFGGVPAYWEQFDPSISLDQNIKANILSNKYLSDEEPSFLLHDFIIAINNYADILREIATGAHRLQEIANGAGFDNRSVSKYLDNLIQTGFVERRIPVTTRGKSRSGRYHISDPYLRFYYRFLAHRQSQLALGITEQTLAEIKRHMVDFIGMYTWEELCREWLLRASGKEIIPFMPDHIGSIWNKDAQIDVAGVNFMEKTLILGECKWTKQLVGVRVLQDLVYKTEKVLPPQGNWTVFFLGFSRQGWKKTALDFRDSFHDLGFGGSRWQASGILLRDLNEIDHELANWTDK